MRTYGCPRLGLPDLALLADSHDDLGVTFARQVKGREAEASYRAALANREKPAADFPAVPDYRGQLALLYSNHASGCLYVFPRVGTV